jgi:hypothetical protein
MKLLSIDANSKLAKTNKVVGQDYLYAGLSMMPDPILCPGSKAAQCMDACLKTSGLGGVFPAIALARQAKTDWFHRDMTEFVEVLVKDLQALVRKANKLGKKTRVRLNVLSDIAWENVECFRLGSWHEGIPQAFPEIEFYDYTKRADRIGKTPSNYRLTFSYSGVQSYARQVIKAQSAGANMAVVFHVKKGQPLPKSWQGKTVIDGDEHDARYDDPQGVIVGLRAKGKAIKDTTGFVVAV